MDKGYKVNNIFNEKGVTFCEVMSTFLLSFLDKEFNNTNENGIISTDIISCL